MEIEEIKECLKQVALSNATNSNVAKTTINYIENMERHILSQNNEISNLLNKLKEKEIVLDAVEEYFSEV